MKRAQTEQKEHINKWKEHIKTIVERICFAYKSVTAIHIVLLDFWLMLLSWMFISFYTTIYFSWRNLFFECFYFSEYDIRMSLYIFWLRKGPSIKYVHNWWGDGGSSKMRTAAYKGRRCHVSSVHTHLRYLFFFNVFGKIFLWSYSVLILFEEN